jgi:hypothetical protein
MLTPDENIGKPPALLQLRAPTLPATLCKHPRRWGVWKGVWRPARNKYDKVPCNPNTGWKASTKDPWWTYDAAYLGYLLNVTADGLPFDGIGFNVTDIEGIGGIDLDHCVSDGVIAPWAHEVIERMQSYAEISPSANGVRIFVAGSVPEDWNNHEQGVEVYGGNGARFLTLTGHHIKGTPADLQLAPAGALEWLAETYRRSAPATTADHRDRPDLIPAETLPDVAALDLAADVLAFLDGESVDDRSRALAVATVALYEATATDGELHDGLVLSLLWSNDHARNVAKDHRPRGDEIQADEAALDYLWQHHCLKMRGKARTVTFDALSVRAAADSSRSSEIGRVDFSTLAYELPEPRRWVVPQWLPVGAVTALFGAGGVGKSLLAQQLAIAVANGDSWLGLPTSGGPVVGFFCEDDESELKRRAARMRDSGVYDPVRASENLHLDARVGKVNALVTFGSDRKIHHSVLLQQLHGRCAELRPGLIILDNLAQLYTGIENDRYQVTAFCNALTGIAATFDCAVLLLGHPAKAEGSQYSGSTAWEAAVRTRLFLDRQKDGTVTLSKAKANYAALEGITLQYEDGVFLPFVVGSGDGPALIEEAKPALLKAVEIFTGRKQPTSHTSTAQNYLVKLMKLEGMLGGIDETIARRALGALIDAGQLEPDSKLSWRDKSRHVVHGLAVKEAPDD